MRAIRHSICLKPIHAFRLSCGSRWHHYQGAHRSSATVCLNASHVLHRQTDRCINSNKSMRIIWQISAHDKNLLKIFQIFYLSKVTFQINYSKNVMCWRCNYMSSSYLYKYFLQISLIIIINIITFLRSHTIRLHKLSYSCHVIKRSN